MYRYMKMYLHSMYKGLKATGKNRSYIIFNNVVIQANIKYNIILKSKDILYNILSI